MDTKVLSERNPLDYLKILFKRKWLIIVPVVIGLIGGMVAGNVLPKVYNASTLILVEEGRIINPLISGLAVSTSTAERLAILREQILGWDRINQLIRALNLAKDVKTQMQFEKLVKGLRDKIAVRLRGPNVISISYDNRDPVLARDIVQTITDIFIAENLRQQNMETETAIAFINDQLDLYKKKLKQAEISGMEEQIKKLLLDSTEKHPVVIDLRQKVEAAKQELASGIYELRPPKAGSADGTELDKMKEELKDIREELATSSLGASDAGQNRTKISTSVNETLYKALLLEKIDEVTAEDAEVNEKLYNTLLERLETAKITQRLEASKDGTRYTVLDPPRVPLKPVKPDKVQMMLLGLFAGGCVGAGLICLMELIDHSFLSVDEVKAHLEQPVLGAISKICTVSDVKRQRINAARITAISVITGIALIVIIIFNVILGA